VSSPCCGIFGISVNYLELHLPSDWNNRPLEGRLIEKDGRLIKVVRTTEAEQLVALSLLALAAIVGLLSSVARQYPWAGVCGLLALMTVAASGIRLAVFLRELQMHRPRRRRHQPRSGPVLPLAQSAGRYLHRP
jgi:hypothetical protein